MNGKYNFKKINKYLFSVLLNTYFRYKILEISTEQNRKQENNKRKYLYKTNEEFTDFVKLIKDNLNIHNSEETLFDTILISDFEENINDENEKFKINQNEYPYQETSFLFRRYSEDFDLENECIKLSNNTYEKYESDSDVDIDTEDSDILEEYRHKRLTIKKKIKN